MTNDSCELAREEINKTLVFCNFCSNQIGISFFEESSTIKKRSFYMFKRMLAIIILVSVVTSEIVYLICLLIKSASVAEIVETLHLIGYGCISIAKMVILIYKRHVFVKLVRELQDIWPMQTDDLEAFEIKKKSLKALRFFHSNYTMFNISAVVFYYMTPILVHIYRKIQGQPSTIGYVWLATYPFDKTKYHELVYIYEAIGGHCSVWFMLTSDLLFTGLTSHISMLLRLLQLKIRRLANAKERQESIDREKWNVNCCEEIVSCVQVHQRLIKYFGDLEDAFSFVNLVNTLLSSVDICCVVFVIVLLEPWMEASNKFFLCAAVTQMGILCWYADEICTTSIEVGDAVYESGWYKSDVRSRRLLLSILLRSQKPLYYTAMKFNNITLRTYASILTTAYSYFALLYTMYNDN